MSKVEVSCFLHTDLLEYLRSKGINRLVIVGMQTQMCVEAAVRAAHDLGFECMLIGDACATRDVKYNGTTVKAADVQSQVLGTITDGDYAKVTDLEDFQKNTDNYLFKKLN